MRQHLFFSGEELYESQQRVKNPAGLIFTGKYVVFLIGRHFKKEVIDFMKKIFGYRDFEQYRWHDDSLTSEIINEARDVIDREDMKPKVFVSHKHDDLEALKDVLSFLTTNLHASVYIDSEDPSLPKKTNGKTASALKDRIESCDRFILLATNGAINSKWCNWELGFGDAQKFKSGYLAILPMYDQYDNSRYTGEEYMEIYPHIIMETMNGYPEYYVEYENKRTPLKDWLHFGL